jgi:molybdopterin/thiamine biosynthesis adenylyltransferase
MAATMAGADRYSRHITIPEIGLSGQERIERSRILVIGAGGLGAPVLTYLAAAGVGSIGVVDDDVVEVSNLQRQVIYTEDTIGCPKVEAAAKALRAMNSAVRISTYQTRLGSSNWRELMGSYDMVIDATDNFATKYTVGEAAYLLGVPHIWASVYQFYGQVSVFYGGGRGPCYRCAFPEPAPPRLVPNGAELGVLGAVCATLASIQVSEAMKIICGVGKPLAGRILTWDARAAAMETYTITRDPGCLLCGDSPLVDVATDDLPACSARARVNGQTCAGTRGMEPSSTTREA